MRPKLTEDLSVHQVSVNAKRSNWLSVISQWISNRNVFFRIKFDRDYYISIDCVWHASKDPLRNFKGAKYLNAVISRGLVMKHSKKQDVNFAMSSSVAKLWRRYVSLTTKCAILPKLHLISWTGKASVLFHDFLLSFCISDIFVNYIISKKVKIIGKN